MQAETPHPGGVFVDEDLQAGDSGHQGRILRPPGDSGLPPVILRRGIQYRTTSWQRVAGSRASSAEREAETLKAKIAGWVAELATINGQLNSKHFSPSAFTRYSSFISL